MRGSVSSQMGHVWAQIDGIGLSKADTRLESGFTSIDGERAVSGLVHSYEYKDEIMRTGKDLAEFARANFGEKNMEKIDGEILQAFIDKKIENGVSRGTLENYISHLAKIEIGLERIAENAKKSYTGFSRDDLKEVREAVKEIAPNERVNRAYHIPWVIVSNLERGEYITGRLQLEYGLRVSEATHIKESQLDGNILTYQGKGGFRHTKELHSDLVQSIRENMENGRFIVNQNHYRESIRESARIEGERYNGSHGLRYNYAQETYSTRLESNLEEGLGHDEAHREALAYTSEELGHHREEITLHYLG